MKALARERVEALLNRGELERVEEFVAEDFVNHEAWPGEDRDGPGRACLPGAAHAHARMRDGRSSERWATRDDLGMLQQLGIIPSPAPPLSPPRS